MRVRGEELQPPYTTANDRKQPGSVIMQVLLWKSWEILESLAVHGHRGKESLNTFLCVVGHHTRRPHSVLLTRSLTGVMLCQGKMFSALLCVKWRGTAFPLTLSIQVSLLFAEQGLTLEQRGSGNTVKGIYSALIHSWSFFFNCFWQEWTWLLLY